MAGECFENRNGNIGESRFDFSIVGIPLNLFRMFGKFNEFGKAFISCDTETAFFFFRIKGSFPFEFRFPESPTMNL